MSSSLRLLHSFALGLALSACACSALAAAPVVDPSIVWENATTGQRYIWMMSGTAYSSGVDLGSVPAEWHIAGTGDFNSDGQTDVVWENTSTGDRYVWLMNGTAFSSSVCLGNLSTQWDIAGVGDFNVDGKPDLVWENTSTGDRYIWLMDGTAWISSVYLGNLSTEWHIAGTGDFNADGMPDLVWENTSTGDRYLWLMNGPSWTASVYLGNTPVEWHIASTGDFLSNGQTDILWENTTTGERGIWLMQGTSFSSWASLGIVSSEWKIRGSAPANFALIPAGTFTMGDSIGDGDTNGGTPTHSVTLPAFYMAKTLTTWAQWQTVRDWAVAHGYADLVGIGAGKAATHPVQTVSWYEVVKWSNAKSEMEGLTPCYYTDDAQTTVYRTGEVDMTQAKTKATANGYRLPTEAEWEYAARGGLSGKRFPWGDTIDHTQGNYYSYDDYAYDVSTTRGYHSIYNDGTYPYTSPVGAFAANGYGLYGMAGNVWQWCGDWYGDYDSADQASPQGPDSGTGRVGRGGDWNSDAYYVRSAYRSGYSPVYRYFSVGFRCARSSVP